MPSQTTKNSLLIIFQIMNPARSLYAFNGVSLLRFVIQGMVAVTRNTSRILQDTHKNDTKDNFHHKHKVMTNLEDDILDII